MVIQQASENRVHVGIDCRIAKNALVGAYTLRNEMDQSIVTTDFFGGGVTPFLPCYLFFDGDELVLGFHYYFEPVATLHQRPTGKRIRPQESIVRKFTLSMPLRYDNVYCPYPRIPHNLRCFSRLTVNVGFAIENELAHPAQYLPEGDDWIIKDVNRCQIIATSGVQEVESFEVYNLPEETMYLPELNFQVWQERLQQAANS